MQVIKIDENDIRMMVLDGVRRVLSETKSGGNSTLNTAKKNKKDEFYTRYDDIAEELANYETFLQGKTIYCNCDNLKVSNFFKYFVDNFQRLGLKKVIATGFNANGPGHYGEFAQGDTEPRTYDLNGDGDFRSPECLKILDEADVVVSNPPFSLFREYITLLLSKGKKFIVIGNNNAITYKEIFPYIKNNQLWLGNISNKTMEFALPDHYEKWNRIENGVKYGKVPAVSWFTNIPIKKREEPLELTKQYNDQEYPKYDNYDAINVDKIKDIPMDYDGVMGVPITFLSKYNPDQFEILGHEHDLDGNGASISQFSVGGQGKYKRLLVRRKPSVNESFRGETGLRNLGEESEEYLALQNAKTMMQKGEPPLKIKQTTGWEIGYDGNWKYEGVDGTLRKTPTSQINTLGDIWDDDDLYKWYPQIRNTRINWKDTDLANFASATPGTIVLPNSLLQYPKHFVETTIQHEIQHIIQSIELWDSGRPSPDIQKYREILDTLHQQLRHAEKYKDIATPEECYQLYKNTEKNSQERTFFVEMLYFLRNGYTTDDYIESIKKEISNYPSFEKLYQDEYYNSNGEREAYQVNKRYGWDKDKRRNTLMTK